MLTSRPSDEYEPGTHHYNKSGNVVVICKKCESVMIVPGKTKEVECKNCRAHIKIGKDGE